MENNLQLPQCSSCPPHTRYRYQSHRGCVEHSESQIELDPRRKLKVKALSTCLGSTINGRGTHSAIGIIGGTSHLTKKSRGGCPCKCLISRGILPPPCHPVASPKSSSGTFDEISTIPVGLVSRRSCLTSCLCNVVAVLSIPRAVRATIVPKGGILPLRAFLTPMSKANRKKRCVLG